MISDRTATFIIVVVTVFWAANILMGMIPATGYKPSESINGIFISVVGGALALRAKGSGGGNGSGGGDHKK